MKDIFTVKNCKIVNEGDIFEGDVLVKEGRFLKIGSDIKSQGETIDAAGLFLFPGVIDDQVHFREPGLIERGNIKTESPRLSLAVPLRLWICLMLFRLHWI